MLESNGSGLTATTSRTEDECLEREESCKGGEIRGGGEGARPRGKGIHADTGK